jgi:hypothetical protein
VEEEKLPAALSSAGNLSPLGRHSRDRTRRAQQASNASRTRGFKKGVSKRESIMHITAILRTKHSIQDVFLLQPFQSNPPELVATFFCLRPLDLTVKLASSSCSSVSILFFILFRLNLFSVSSRANAIFLT